MRANLQLLEDVIVITAKDLDEICQQIIKEDLNQGDVDTLMSEVAELVDSTLVVANGLKVKFLEADVELREVSSTSGASTPSTQPSSTSRSLTLRPLVISRLESTNSATSDIRASTSP